MDLPAPFGPGPPLPAATGDRETATYYDLGRMNVTCPHCGAQMWLEERVLKTPKSKPEFTVCCQRGAVQLPPTSDPPEELKELYRGEDEVSRYFLSKIRLFNGVFAFASFGCQLAPMPAGNGPSTFRIQGELYHLIGSAMPSGDDTPRYSQIYFHDSAQDDPATLRLDYIRGLPGAIPNAHEKTIIHIIQNVMARNPYSQKFKTIGERIRSEQVPDFHIRILNDNRGRDPRRYNVPTADEVAVILPGDGSGDNAQRDIVVQLHDGQLDRVSALHPSYLPLAYPLIFPNGDDGFQRNIPRNRPPYRQQAAEQGQATATQDQLDQATTLVVALP
ncbi:hypothetical protein B0O80DRAFT_74182 [Mortierella sp. GBAus27b]|nr:hypothetical protein B0O80DRAFT_74182 [Mortierella sp. GBAus27b]